MANEEAPALTSEVSVVSTTDALKCAGLALVLIDHWGLYFSPTNDAWPLLGRAAAPIFFFLIGFAGSRHVPSSWLWLGAGLTLIELGTAGLEGTTLNILLNFALIRYLVLPLMEAALGSSQATAGVVLGCLVLLPLDNLLEYGTEGWLWALLGLAQRKWLNDPSFRQSAKWQRVGVAVVTLGTYSLREAHDYEFDLLHFVLLALLMSGLTLTLLYFRRSQIHWRVPHPAAAVLRFCGRRSLELYAATLALMQVVSFRLE